MHALADVGIEPPDEWTALRQRHDDYLALQFPIRDKLADALITGSGDIEALRALAPAEQFAQTGTAANVHIEHAVLRRLKDLYDGPTAYTAVAAMFDQAAQKFSDAAALCDVDADGATLVGTPERKQKAWLAAALHASELTRLCVPLCAASTLNGHNVYVSDGPRLLPLCVAVADVSGKRRRQLWTAWDDTDGRTGHWGPLHRAGFTIHALANLDQHAEYRRPLPYRYEQRQIAGAPRGYVEQVAVDPEEQHRNRSTRCADPPAAEWPYDHHSKQGADSHDPFITKCDTVSGVATTRRPLGGQEKS